MVAWEKLYDLLAEQGKLDEADKIYFKNKSKKNPKDLLDYARSLEWKSSR